MNVVLGAIALVLVITTIEGVRHGVVRRAVEIVGLLAIFLFASRLADLLEPWLSDTLGISGKLAFFASWAVVLTAGVVLVRLAAAALSKLLRFSIIGWLDRAGGGVLGLAFGAVLVSCFLVGALALPVSDGFKRDLRDHPLTEPLLHVAPTVYDAMSGLWDGEEFFDMVGEHLDTVADKAKDGIKAFLESTSTDDDGDN